MDEVRRTGALITAAGMSTRMGTLKQTLPLGKKTIIETVVSRFMHVGVSEIVVVTGYRSEEVRDVLKGYPVTFAENPAYATTQMFDSVKIGLKCLMKRCDRIFFTPVDVPAFRESTLSVLLGQAGQIIIPVSHGKKGHPIMISVDLIPQLLSFEGDGGLRGAFEAAGIKPAYVDVNDEGALIDADTPEDYQKVKVLFNQINERESNI